MSNIDSNDIPPPTRLVRQYAIPNYDDDIGNSFEIGEIPIIEEKIRVGEEAQEEEDEEDEEESDWLSTSSEESDLDQLVNQEGEED